MIPRFGRSVSDFSLMFNRILFFHTKFNRVFSSMDQTCLSFKNLVNFAESIYNKGINVLYESSFMETL